jgi:hypothetical protein
MLVGWLYQDKQALIGLELKRLEDRTIIERREEKDLLDRTREELLQERTNIERVSSKLRKTVP